MSKHASGHISQYMSTSTCSAVEVHEYLSCMYVCARAIVDIIQLTCECLKEKKTNTIQQCSSFHFFLGSCSAMGQGERESV